MCKIIEITLLTTGCFLPLPWSSLHTYVVRFAHSFVSLNDVIILQEIVTTYNNASIPRNQDVVVLSWRKIIILRLPQINLSNTFSGFELTLRLFLETKIQTILEFFLLGKWIQQFSVRICTLLSNTHDIIYLNL